MNGEEAYKLQEELSADELLLRQLKMHDYSGDSNALANFWVLADICKAFDSAGMGIDLRTPHGWAAGLQLLKIARFQSLVTRKVSPSNESLRDTIMDDRIYCALKWMCYREFQLRASLMESSGWADG